MNDVVEITDLTVSFATDAGQIQAVDGITLSVHPGEVLAVVGESGSGKTVTAKTILGLLPETARVRGAVVLSSKDGATEGDVVQMSASRLRQVRGRDAAMVFQEPSTALNPVYPVGWQIIEGLRAHGSYTKAEARAKAIDVMRRVGIPDPEERIDHYPHQFSGGQKQRIVIAQALILDPGVIVADEPTTALDVTVQAEILDLLRRCRDEFGAAVVLITHNMGVVADLADRVAVMYQGKLVEQADVRTLFASPKEPYTQQLLAAVPRIGEGLARAHERAARRPEGWAGTEPVVAAHDLRIVYPGRFRRPDFVAVDGVDFAIRPGEVLGLVGESGSGKTTIGRAMAGLTRVSGGSLRVLGVEMHGVHERDFRPVRSRIGFVFQDPADQLQPAAHYRRVRGRAARGARQGRERRGRQGAGRRAARGGAAAQLLRRAVPARAVRRPASARQPGAGARARPRAA